MMGVWNRIEKAGRAGSDRVQTPTSTFRPKDHELSLHHLTILNLSFYQLVYLGRGTC